MDNKNAVSVHVVGSILTPADFGALDKLITSLGENSAKLTDEEKKQASAIIDDWNESVIARIAQNVDAANDVIAFLSGRRIPDGTAKNIIENFVELFGETPEYLAYENASREYENQSFEAPMEPIVTEDMTIAQIDSGKLEYQRECLIYNRKLQAAVVNLRKAATDYVRSLNDMPQVQEARQQLTAYKRKASRMQNECRDKATKAKINITINNEETRKLLHELLDFAKTV